MHPKGYLVAAPMPPWLTQLTKRVSDDVLVLAEAGGPNHVLINSYQPGEGIMVRGQGVREGGRGEGPGGAGGWRVRG